MPRTTWTDADACDYVECSECGHPIEDHDRHGSVANAVEPLQCRGYTMADKRYLRRGAGLPPRSVKHGVS